MSVDLVSQISQYFGSGRLNERNTIRDYISNEFKILITRKNKPKIENK